MPIFTIIGRLSDGLTLTQSMASQSDPYRKEVQEYERQAKKLLMSSAHEEQKSLLYNQNSSQPAPYVTAEAGDQFCFHYTSGNGVCFLTLTEKNYPRRYRNNQGSIAHTSGRVTHPLFFLFPPPPSRLAYDYLDELRNEFLSVYRDQIASASRPYEFIRFGKTLELKWRNESRC